MARKTVTGEVGYWRRWTSEYANRGSATSPRGREFRPRPSAGRWRAPIRSSRKPATPSCGRFARPAMCSTSRPAICAPAAPMRSWPCCRTPPTFSSRRCCAASPTRFIGMATASSSPIPRNDPEREREHAGFIQGGRVDGVLLLNGRLLPSPAAKRGQQVPTVSLCERIPGSRLPHVETANRDAARAMTEYLPEARAPSHRLSLRAGRQCARTRSLRRL